MGILRRVRGWELGILGCRTTRNPQLTTRNYRGQAILEYATIIAVICAMLLAMSIYVKRGLSGRWRQVGDTFGQGRQFEPNTTVVTN